MLNLDRKLDYKVRKKNPAAWAQLCDYLSALQDDAALAISNAREMVLPLRVQKKENEDKLDAIVAAYIAAYFWRYGTSRSTVLGSLASGYIVTPHSPLTKVRFENVFTGALNPVGTAHSCRPSRGVPSAPIPWSRNHAELMNALDVPQVSADFIWDGQVELTASDTTNLWSNRNPWLLREKCEGFDLLVKILDEDEPVLRFVPFTADGRRQGGMAIGAGDTQRTVWRHLASDASLDSAKQGCCGRMASVSNGDNRSIHRWRATAHHPLRGLRGVCYLAKREPGEWHGSCSLPLAEQLGRRKGAGRAAKITHGSMSVSNDLLYRAVWHVTDKR